MGFKRATWSLVFLVLPHKRGVFFILDTLYDLPLLSLSRLLPLLLLFNDSLEVNHVLSNRIIVAFNIDFNGRLNRQNPGA